MTLTHNFLSPPALTTCFHFFSFLRHPSIREFFSVTDLCSVQLCRRNRSKILYCLVLFELTQDTVPRGLPRRGRNPCGSDMSASFALVLRVKTVECLLNLVAGLNVIANVLHSYKREKKRTPSLRFALEIEKCQPSVFVFLFESKMTGCIVADLYTYVHTGFDFDRRIFLGRMDK